MRGPRGLLIIACALGLSGCGNPANVDACQNHVAALQALPCAVGPDGAPLDPGLDCPAFIDYPCPATGYFACLTSNSVCNADGVFENAGIVNCELKCD